MRKRKAAKIARIEERVQISRARTDEIALRGRPARSNHAAQRLFRSAEAKRKPRLEPKPLPDLDGVHKIVAGFVKKPGELSPSSDIRSQLAGDRALTWVELVMQVEEAYDVQLSEGEQLQLKTLRDFVAMLLTKLNVTPAGTPSGSIAVPVPE